MTTASETDRVTTAKETVILSSNIVSHNLQAFQITIYCNIILVLSTARSLILIYSI